MNLRFRRMRHFFWSLPKIYPGTVNRVTGAGVNVLADARSATSWCNASNSLIRRLDFGGCQRHRYSSVPETKHAIYSDDVLSFIRSSLHHSKGPSHCWINTTVSIKNFFKEDGVFLVLIGEYDGSLGANQTAAKMFEKAKLLQQRYPSLQVMALQHGKSISLNDVSKHFLHRTIQEYVTFPILLSSNNVLKMSDVPCYIISEGFQNPVVYSDEDVDLKALDEAILDLNVKKSSKGANVDDGKSTWAKPIEVVKEPDVCSALRNLLFSFPGCISVDEGGNRLFLSDVNHHRIIVFNSNGKILDAIGSSPGFEDGEFEIAKLMRPAASFYHAYEDCLYFVDSENHSIRRADMERRVVETVFPVTDGGKMNKGLWKWILNQIWTRKSTKSMPEEFNSESFLFPWHLLRSPNDDNDILVLNQSFETLWVLDLESGSVREVVKETSKIMEICGQAISEKCNPLKHMTDVLLQQKVGPTRSFEGIPYAGLMSSVVTCKDHVVLCDTVGQTVVKVRKESGLASSFRFTNFGVLGLPYWLTSSLEQLYTIDGPSSIDIDHSQCFRLLPGRVDIVLCVDIPRHADLVEVPQEGCIWRQARGSAIEVSGVEIKVESAEKVGVAQQWYDEIDNLSFSTPELETSIEEEESRLRSSEEAREGRIRIGCTVNTSPGTSEAIIYAALYLRLKNSNSQGESRENKAIKIADILDPKRKFKKETLVNQLMLMPERDLEEVVFMRPLHVRIKFNCKHHAKADDNSKAVVLTDSSVEAHVVL